MLYHNRVSDNINKIEGLYLLGYDAMMSEKKSVDVSEQYVASILNPLHNERCETHRSYTTIFYIMVLIKHNEIVKILRFLKASSTDKL
jgi:hypothetical protein